MNWQFKMNKTYEFQWNREIKTNAVGARPNLNINRELNIKPPRFKKGSKAILSQPMNNKAPASDIFPDEPYNNAPKTLLQLLYEGFSNKEYKMLSGIISQVVGVYFYLKPLA